MSAVHLHYSYESYSTHCCLPSVFIVPSALIPIVSWWKLYAFVFMSNCLAWKSLYFHTQSLVLAVISWHGIMKSFIIERRLPAEPLFICFFPFHYCGSYHILFYYLSFMFVVTFSSNAWLFIADVLFEISTDLCINALCLKGHLAISRNHKSTLIGFCK